MVVTINALSVANFWASTKCPRHDKKKSNIDYAPMTNNQWLCASYLTKYPIRHFSSVKCKLIQHQNINKISKFIFKTGSLFSTEKTVLHWFYNINYWYDIKIICRSLQLWQARWLLSCLWLIELNNMCFRWYMCFALSPRPASL